MKKLTTLGLALGAALAFAGTAQAQIKMGVAGPLTGPNAAFGAQLKNGTEQAVEDINAAGGIMGQKITVTYRRRRVRSQAGRLGRQQVRRRRRQVRGRPLQLRRHHAGVRSLCQENGILEITPVGHQPEDHRARHVEHVPHLRPRRPAGRGRRRPTSSRTSRARRSRSSTTRRPTARALPTRPRRA